MMSFGAYAAITPSARYVVMQNDMRRLPRGMLRIRQRIQVDNRGTERRRYMHRPTVVRYQHLRAIDQGCQLAEFERACEIDGHAVYPACLRTYVRFVVAAGD